MTSIFSTGVCAEEILQFTSYSEAQKLSRVNRLFNNLVNHDLMSENIDLTGFSVENPVQFIKSRVRRPSTRSVRLDCTETDFEAVFEEILLHLDHLKTVEIRFRRADGSVLIPTRAKSSSDSGLNFTSQFTLNHAQIKSLIHSTLNSSVSVTGLFFERGTSIESNEEMVDFLAAFPQLTHLELGDVSPSIDFDEIYDLFSKLTYLKITDFNASLETLKKMNQKIPNFQVPALLALLY
jgi:hypothetical protein